jgi:hypothetical protein
MCPELEFTTIIRPEFRAIIRLELKNLSLHSKLLSFASVEQGACTSLNEARLNVCKHLKLCLKRQKLPSSPDLSAHGSYMAYHIMSLLIKRKSRTSLIILWKQTSCSHPCPILTQMFNEHMKCPLDIWLSIGSNGQLTCPLEMCMSNAQWTYWMSSIGCLSVNWIQWTKPDFVTTGKRHRGFIDNG